MALALDNKLYQNEQPNLRLKLRLPSAVKLVKISQALLRFPGGIHCSYFGEFSFPSVPPRSFFLLQLLFLILLDDFLGFGRHLFHLRLGLILAGGFWGNDSLWLEDIAFGIRKTGSILGHVSHLQLILPNWVVPFGYGPLWFYIVPQVEGSPVMPMGVV